MAAILNCYGGYNLMWWRLVLKVTLVFCFTPKELWFLDSELDQAEQKYQTYCMSREESERGNYIGFE